MDGYKFLKPINPNTIIRDPITKMILPPSGELKPWIGSEGTFWRRRVNDGSCLIIEIKQEENGIKFDGTGRILKKGGS